MDLDTWLTNTADIDAWYGEPDEQARIEQERRNERLLDEEMERYYEERRERDETPH